MGKGVWGWRTSIVDVCLNVWLKWFLSQDVKIVIRCSAESEFLKVPPKWPPENDFQDDIKDSLFCDMQQNILRITRFGCDVDNDFTTCLSAMYNKTFNILPDSAMLLKSKLLHRFWWMDVNTASIDSVQNIDRFSRTVRNTMKQTLYYPKFNYF